MDIVQLLGKLEAPFTGEALFDHLPDIVFFIKNEKGEYLAVNNTLVVRCGQSQKDQLLGKTSAELMRPPLGQRYMEQDLKVVNTGQPLIAQLELHLFATRDVGWCLTTKLPLKSQTGKVIGLVGVSQDLRLPNLDTDEYQHVSAAVSFAQAHLSAPPSIGELAKVADMSVYQLDRRMRSVFGLTTGQWLLKTRIDRARQQLRDSEAPIASIAMNAGYSDQSAFTRQFRRATGLSPREYRETRTTNKS